MVARLHVVIIRAGSVLILDGINTYIWNLAYAFSQYGMRVTVISGYNKLMDNVDKYNVKHYVRKYFGVNFTGEWYVLKDTNLLFKNLEVIDLLKVLEPDIVHANTAMLLPYRIPKILTFHGLLNFANRLRAFNFAMNIVYDKMCHRSFNKIIAVSRKALNEFLKYISKRANITVVPPMINMSEIRRKFKYTSEREFAILHRGTHLRKNLATTLLVFRVLKREFPNLKLWIIGDPQDVMRQIKAFNIDSKDIEVFINIPWIKLQELYAKACVTIFPSFYEAFGYVALESLAHGTPVVASSAVAEELVRHGYNGFIVSSPHDVHSFVNYIKRLLTRKDVWNTMSLNALKTASMFDVKKLLPKILKVYISVLES